VSAELFHADGRTDGHNEANSRFSQFCERAEKRTQCLTNPYEFYTDVTQVETCLYLEDYYRWDNRNC